MKNNEYTAQAEKFLMDTGTTLSIVEAVPQKKPLWVKDGHGINYSVTLSNKNGSYTFDFWDSIANKMLVDMAREAIARGQYSAEWERTRDFLQKHKVNAFAPYGRDKETGENALISKVKALVQPNAYSILTCLDVLHEETFEDFASSYGYDADSITALKTYEEVKEQDRNLRRLFTHAQLKALQEIQ